MSEIVFYNRNGAATAYSDDSEHIYLFNGKPVAYFYDDSVYGYNGKHLGYFTDGWLRDNQGNCVFFTEEAIGGPVKPIKQIKPIKNVKNIKPIKSVRQIKPIKPISSLSWSSRSSVNFFS
ncbi:4-fold beta flower protein [Bacillus subtilis]|uniref:4-fold beta flower protein n=1 Tax=Bacillus subtilis TaxID=1423 RepID=UPI0031F4CD36